MIFDRTASACLRSVGGAPANVGTAPRQRGMAQAATAYMLHVRGKTRLQTGDVHAKSMQRR